MTPEQTGKTETLVIEGAPGRLTKKQLEEARRAMARLKFHPREALPNATLLARADALFMELTGIERDHLGQCLAQFRLALESQDEKLIEPAKEQLASVLAQLRR